MSEIDKSKEKLLQKIPICRAFGLTPKESIILLTKLGFRLKLDEIMGCSNK